MSLLPVGAEIAGGRLVLGGVDAAELVERFGTPLWVYDEATLRQRSRAYMEGLASYPGSSRAVFACKAQATVSVLRLVIEEGLGADAASEGELAAALRAGAEPANVVIHGNNKSRADIETALAVGAGLIVVDHLAELELIEELAAAAGRVQPILVRVTPDIVADTHHKIVTGHAASKFGLAPPDALDALDRAASLDHLEPRGLHIHLGSQIDDLSTYLQAVDWLVEFIESNGLGELPVLDLGGGLGVAHLDEDIEPDIASSVETIAQHLAEGLIAHGLPLPELIVEPGRSIADRAGVTLYTVGAIKHTAAGVVYAAVDGGMSDNPRPTLYGARYEAFVIDRADADGDRTYAVAGKHCESGDVLIERTWLPELNVGDVLCIPVTGAYTASMASNYNLLPRPAAVIVADGRATPALRRETMQDLLARDLG